ncbi:3-hydroxyacyl-CoA dehydratase [Malassezia pachydermatis]|uniref:Very-long-chain (3R)-3-hydroxyacyl-CoA dehydratase n=1 Tax=Malassezia pachydermatis TaxID=77020 RepID=A0A0M9VR56_9BASI|nr:hypothetical protein Malapachy_3140 [Malassezia pachydermatis]KOS16259.1 hypothetical protein Malapachy_3140 [Malassezia pachydermatis]
MSGRTASVKNVSKKQNSSAVNAYLIVYNLVSFMFWLRVLCGIVLYMVRGDDARTVTYQWMSDLCSKFFHTKVTSSIPSYAGYPSMFREVLYRASTMYDYLGPLLTVTQSLALLEVVHALLGWVKSSALVTMIQVASRIIIAWFVVEKYDAAAHSPFYTVMILAWSLSEVARYPFYVNQILETPSYMSMWARYSFFVVLYPMGVLGEMQLIWASLPKNVAWPWVDASNWSNRDLFFLALLPVYIPGLFMLYTRLLASRRKVLGNDFAGTKAREMLKKLHHDKFEHIRRLHEKQNTEEDLSYKAELNKAKAN